MKLEVGKKYTDGRDVVEIKFIDWEGSGWGLTDERNSCRYIKTYDTAWTEVIDKPNPGEGWRLLEVGEKLQEGDQFYNSVADWVGACLTWSGGVVQQGSVYRRRIAPQYVSYTWEDREGLRDRWFRLKDSSHIECKVLEFKSKSGEYLRINGIDSRQFLKDYEWLDGSPCGKRV